MAELVGVEWKLDLSWSQHCPLLCCLYDGFVVKISAFLSAPHTFFLLANVAPFPSNVWFP